MTARHEARMERWRSLSRESAAIGVAGVIAKALTPAGLVLLGVGLLGVPVLVYVGGAIAVLGLVGWWWAAHVLAPRVGLSTGRVMWKIWLVATWTFLADLSDAF